MTTQTVALSKKSLDLLADAIFNGNNEKFTEFDSEGYKPFTPLDIAALVDAGFVVIVGDSDHVPSLSDLKQAIELDSVEEIDGSVYILATNSGIEYAKSISLEVD
jgi:hypothetical protein